MTLSISIIIPVFNREQLIAETIESVRSQTLSSWQCILVDDGSTDGTIRKIKELTVGDHRFKLLRRTNNHKPGGNGARNLGLENAAGTHVIFLDSDDVLHYKALENRLKTIRNYINDEGYLFGTYLFYKKPGDSSLVWNLQKSSETLEDLELRFIKQDMPWHTNGAVWSKSFIKRLGGWDEDLKAWQDWEFHLRILNSSPRLFCAEANPDNYYRVNTPASIAASHKSESYLINVSKALKKIELLLGEKIDRQTELKTSFKRLVIRNLIYYPSIHGMRTLPFKFMLNKKFKSINRFTFLMVTLFIWFLSFHKMRHLAKRIGYFDRLNETSTHLKYSL